MSKEEVIEMQELHNGPNKIEYEEEIETSLQSYIRSKIDFLLNVGAFWIAKWWIKLPVLIYLGWNVVCNFYISLYGKNTMCTWFNITIFILILESLILYICAYICVNDDFLNEVITALTKIITES